MSIEQPNRRVAGTPPLPGSGAGMPVLLDHLTAIEATPEMLIEIAADEGYAGVCPFLRPMRALPRLPPFRLVGDRLAIRTIGDAARRSGMTVEMAYPFSLTGEAPAAHDALLEAAAQIGARSVNVLCFVDDPPQRIDALGAFADRARGFGLGTKIEFYPASSVRSLDDGLQLLDHVGSNDITLTCDLLHLHRSGGTVADLRRAGDRIGLLQLCDGPASLGGQDPFAEASSGRLLPGEGVFDIAGAVAACPPGTPISIECPVRAEGSAREKARAARAATLRCLAHPRNRAYQSLGVGD